MSVTVIDVGGDNLKPREFIEAETPGSISFGGNNNKSRQQIYVEG